MSNGNLIRFEIQGLKELQDSLNMERINKQVAVGIGIAAKSFTSELGAAITSRYNINPSRFNNALVGSSISLQETGKNIIKNSIELRDIPLSLSRFVTDKTWGNIPPIEGKKRKGWVHTVTVRRNQPKTSMGKYGYGGFTVKGGKVMVERTGPTRDAKLRTMYGPNIVDMSNWLIDNDTKVQRAFINLSDVVLEHITL